MLVAVSIGAIVLVRKRGKVTEGVVAVRSFGRSRMLFSTKMRGLLERFRAHERAAIQTAIE